MLEIEKGSSIPQKGVSVRRTGQTTTGPTPARPGDWPPTADRASGAIRGGWRRSSVPIISRWIGSRRLATAIELVRWPANDPVQMVPDSRWDGGIRTETHNAGA